MQQNKRLIEYKIGKSCCSDQFYYLEQEQNIESEMKYKMKPIQIFYNFSYCESDKLKNKYKFLILISR